MEALYYGLIVLAIYIIYINIVATISLLKSQLLNRFQTVGQAIFVWFFPFIGSKVVLHMLSEAEPDSVRWAPRVGLTWLYPRDRRVESLDRHIENEPHVIESSGGGSSD